MEPKEIIQLLRTLNVAQIRQQLEKMSKNSDPTYDDVTQFFIDASKQEIQPQG